MKDKLEAYDKMKDSSDALLNEKNKDIKEMLDKLEGYDKMKEQIADILSVKK